VTEEKEEMTGVEISVVVTAEAVAEVEILTVAVAAVVEDKVAKVAAEEEEDNSPGCQFEIWQ
jgi:hypothetical protein